MAKYHFANLLILCFLTSPASLQQHDEGCCRIATSARKLSELGSEYRRLRRQVGSKCCDRFNSGLMQVMSALQDSLQPGVSTKSIKALMGRPDLRTSKGYGAIEPPPGNQLLIYHWRGSHDFLYFIVSHSRVTNSEWYNAWE